LRGWAALVALASRLWVLNAAVEADRPGRALRLARHVAARRIQRCWRLYIERKRADRLLQVRCELARPNDLLCILHAKQKRWSFEVCDTA
jgi:hypothetical protein